MIIFQPEIMASDSTRKRGPSDTKTEPRKRALEKDTLIEICIRGPKMGPISCPEIGPDFGPLCPAFRLKRALSQGRSAA